MREKFSAEERDMALKNAFAHCGRPDSDRTCETDGYGPHSPEPFGGWPSGADTPHAETLGKDTASDATVLALIAEPDFRRPAPSTIPKPAATEPRITANIAKLPESLQKEPLRGAAAA